MENYTSKEKGPENALSQQTEFTKQSEIGSIDRVQHSNNSKEYNGIKSYT